MAVVPESWRQRERPSPAVVARLTAAGLLVVHGLTHLLWFVPSDSESWPYRVDGSWLLHEASVARPVATVLVILTVIGFLLVGLAVAGVHPLGVLWPGLAAPVATLSLLMLVTFWDPRLTFGAVVNVAIAVTAAWWTEWRMTHRPDEG